MKANTFAVELAMARKRKRLTQDEACKLIGISEPSVLSRWENGREIPSKEIMKSIILAYEDNLLGYIYLQKCDPVGELVLPDVVRRTLGNSVLVLQKEYRDINRIKDDLVDIACDDEIDETEQERWNGSIKEVKELAGACIGLSLIQNKMPSQGGNLERATI